MTMSTSATLGLHPRYLEISRNGRVRGSALQVGGVLYLVHPGMVCMEYSR
jgi:hypothetical protein